MIPLLVMSREVGGLTTKCLKRCHFSMPAYDAGLLRFADTSLVEQGPECPSRKRQPYVPQAPLDHSKKSEGRQGFNGPVPTIGGAPFGGARVLREIPTIGGAPFGVARFCVKSHDQPVTASLARSLRSWPLGALAPAHHVKWVSFLLHLAVQRR